MLKVWKHYKVLSNTNIIACNMWHFPLKKNNGKLYNWKLKRNNDRQTSMTFNQMIFKQNMRK